jgi:lysophospholipase L1-like esterase
MTIRIEAESMRLSGYSIETGQTFASGNAVIAVTPTEGAVGTASTTFTGVSSSYDIVLGYYDESDGASRISVYINNVLIDNWTLNRSGGGTRASASNFFTRTIATGYALSTNDEIRISGTTHTGERARIDYLEFVPRGITVNTNPVAEDDSYSVNEDTSLSVNSLTGVLSNDRDVDGDSITVTAFDAVSRAGGRVSVNNDGSFSYTPVANFNGIDSFNYTVSDGRGGIDTAIVTLNVNGVEDVPVAVADSYSTTVDRNLTITASLGVLANDFDGDRDTLTIFSADSQTAASGAIAVNTDGSFSYIPASGFSGIDNFNYTITDGKGNTATATATIRVERTPPTRIKIEAESMRLSGYSIETVQTFASGNAVIAVTPTEGAVGTASTTFTGVSSSYDIVLGYYDESDGASRISVYINNVLVDNWTLDRAGGGTRASASNFFTRTIATGYALSTNDEIRISGTTHTGERARIDYLEFVPREVVAPGNHNPVAQDESYSMNENTSLTVALATGVVSNDRDVDGDRLRVTAFDAVSRAGGRVSVNSDGSFSYTPTLNFNGIDSFNYTVSDGRGGSDTATASIEVFSVTAGETANYSSAANGIIANLSTGLVLAPIFGTNPNPTIMPLGDSITAGQHSIGAVPGAYRIKLWERFQDDGLNINFVGGSSNGPPSLGDKNHQGQPGWKINRITSDLVDRNLFQNYPSDVILLTIGTNDINNGASVSRMIADLGALIDRIHLKSPNSRLVVSSIPPVEAPRGTTSMTTRINSYNAQMKLLVDAKAANGYKVYFTDAGGSLTVNDINGELGDGLHPTEAGYHKLGNAWYEALVKRDLLRGIDNLIGSEFDDRLMGSDDFNILEGRGGNDTLQGTTADLAGANERDTLFGGAGSDRFILGDATQAYYQISGELDRVAIEDFQINIDLVQLHGSTDDYLQEQVGSDRYLRLTENNDLIAIFTNTSELNLSGGDFIFV